jgi:hypothetical protein
VKIGGTLLVISDTDQAAVFPLDAEPVQKQDGTSKNDCEQNAAKRLIPRLAGSLPPGFKGLALMDALYPTGPCLNLLAEHGLSYIITIKEGYVLVQAEKLAEEGQLQELTWTDGHKLCKVEWAQSAWITDLPLSADKMPEMVAVARARWKVENETFNTLKNQEYNLEHNYGHGKKFLASNLALLMMLAFLVDQIAQHADMYFQKALNYCKTRKNLWEKVRQVFDILPCMSMNVIYRFIVKEVKLDFPLLE